MKPRIIFSPDAPEPIGPYSQAIDCGDLVFVSGQIPLDPDTGEVAGTTVGEQTAQVVRNLEAVLSSCGLSLNSVVKTTVYLKSIGDFQAFNAVYEELLNGWKPARAVIQAAALPRDVLVEIEAVAHR